MEKTQRANVATKVTLVGFIINMILTIGKLFIGYVYGSMALIADGLHSFSDFISDIFIMISFQLAKKPADENHNYGHGRIEVMSELLVSVMLFLVASGMIKSGVTQIRYFDVNEVSSISLLVLFTAFGSIVTKEGLYWYTMIYAKKLKSNAMEANAVHHRSDAISSVAVLVALGFAKILGPNWYILDPIIAVCVAVYIIIIALKILIKSFAVLIDGAVDKDDYQKIFDILSKIDNTSDPHNIRTRKIGSYIAIELHIRVNPDMKVREAHKIATSIETKLKTEFGQDTFVSVHIEPEKVNGEYR